MHHFLSAKRKSLPPRQKAFEALAAGDPDGNIDAIQKQYERGRKILAWKNWEQIGGFAS